MQSGARAYVDHDCSARSLRPPDGDAVLPEDLRAIIHRARRADVPVPMLDSILRSNERQADASFRTTCAGMSTDPIGRREVRRWPPARWCGR